MFCRCWTPHQEFNGCRFHIWASLDSLFSWMLGGGIRCTSRMGSICGADPQDLTRLAGRMFVAVQHTRQLWDPAEWDLSGLNWTQRARASSWAHLLVPRAGCCSCFPCFHLAPCFWDGSTAAAVTAPCALVLFNREQVLFSGSCSHYTRCCWGLAPLPLRDFCALLSLFVLRPLSDAFSLANTFS